MNENKVFLIFDNHDNKRTVILNFYNTLELLDEINEEKQNLTLKDHAMRITALENETMSINQKLVGIEKRINSKIMTSSTLDVDNEENDYLIYVEETGLRIAKATPKPMKALKLTDNSNIKLGGWNYVN